MKIIPISPPQRFVVISDVHLRQPDDTLTQKFISTLDQLSQIDTLFLLGDIFDFISAESPFFFDYWQNVFQCFRRVKDKGIRVYFIEGNHDFGFEHFHSTKLDDCFTEYGDMIIEFDSPQLGKTFLRHGDNVVCPKHYLTFRALIKSRSFQTLVSFLFPGKFQHFLFSRYAKISRKQDAYRTLPDDFLEECLHNHYIQNAQVKTLIIGHIHLNKNNLTQDGVHFIVGPDWLSQPNYLKYSDENGFERIFVN